MTGIIDYAHTETRSFADLPFNEIDALIISTLIYEDVASVCPTLMLDETRSGSFAARIRAFEPKHPLIWLKGIWHPELESVSLDEANRELHRSPETHADDKPHEAQMVSVVNPDLTHDLFQAAGENPRYANVRLGAVVEHINQGEQTQFAAATFQLPDGHKRRKPTYKGTLVISFRGTDDSLTGWREDFNMAFTYPVPAQKQAADYLEKVGRLWPNARIMLTGHSKGGNIAIYAAMNARDQIKDRIERIYAFDSPGFNQDVVSSYEYGTIVDRITKLVPEFSIIGMLLQSSPREHMIVVKSNADGLMQHSCYTWLMDGDRFDTVPALSESSRDFRGALNTWLNGMTQRQREHGVEALFRVLSSGGHSTITQLRTDGMKALPGLFSSYVGLDSEDRHYINQAIMLLAGTRFTH